MPRVITVGAAQLGPIARRDSRSDVVKRLVSLLGQAHARGCDLVVFPELALTTFFPRWWMEDQAEIDAFFEREMPGPETRPLWDEVARLGDPARLGAVTAKSVSPEPWAGKPAPGKQFPHSGPISPNVVVKAVTSTFPAE